MWSGRGPCLGMMPEGPAVAAQGETNISSVIFNSSGTAFYALGFQLDTVLEYATTALAYVTTVKAGQAVSATTINMKDLT